mgnify:CR=1 FL=1
MRRKKENNFITGLKNGQREFGETIAIIVNSVLLTGVYILAVGITSTIAKIAGNKFLDTKLNKEAKTYWSELNIGKKPIEEYYRQF